LFLLYKYVLSIEIRQLQEVPVGELRRRIEQLHYSARFANNSNASIKVYLYNEYAKAMQSLQQQLQVLQKNYRKRHPKTAKDCDDDIDDHDLELFVSMQNVPALCILPQKEQSDDWYDKCISGVSSSYCLCIGGDSTMRIAATTTSNHDDDDETECVHFASDDMILSFLAVCCNGRGDDDIMVEYQIKNGRLQTIREKDTTSDIGRYYKSYRRRNSAPVEDNVSADTTAAAANEGTAAAGDADTTAINTENARLSLASRNVTAARDSDNTATNGQRSTAGDDGGPNGGGAKRSAEQGSAALRQETGDNDGSSARKRQRTNYIKKFTDLVR
jgi:hypothetical protein